MNNAIVLLCRGHHSLKGYDSLIARNKAINEFIGNKYPLLIFNEGDITPEQQEYINSQTPELNIIYKDISNIFRKKYEGMCAFYAIQVWELCSEYDYIMRLDDDVIITACPENPFQMGNNVYLRSVYFAESHSETNATLPQAIEKLTGVSKEDFYNDKFVYTNGSVSSVKFWLSEPVYPILKEIAMSNAQLENRWGDLPILGSLLNIYAKDRVGCLTGLTYSHLSHNNVIVSDNWIDYIGGALKPVIYSQYGEEHYIRYILNQVGETNKHFVDIGANDGTYLSNTKLLSEQGWNGLLIEGKEFPLTKQHFVTKENILEILESYNTPIEFDLLSIDIDGNDYWVLQEILTKYKPRLIVSEYNAEHNPQESKAIEYNPDFVFKANDYYGYTLEAGKKLAAKCGYTIIFTNSCLNAYYLRNDLVPKGVEINPTNEQHAWWGNHSNEKWIEI